MRAQLSALVLGSLLLVAGCDGKPEPATSSGAPGGKPRVLRLATTTSTRDSGLLDELLPLFSEESGVRVDVIAVGTGKALKLGELGEVDAVLVHAEAAEKAFMDAGHGIRREPVMYNTFQILGPAADPAEAQGVNAVEALKRIAAAQAKFVSRGDDSGTHKRERHLWGLAGGRPEWHDYIESGNGMGASLIMASEMQAYILTDSGTYLSMREKLELSPLVTEGDDLRNPYSVMTVDPAKHASIRTELATELVEFLISKPIQERIAEFKVGGEPLFVPLRLGGE